MAGIDVPSPRLRGEGGEILSTGREWVRGTHHPLSSLRVPLTRSEFADISGMPSPRKRGEGATTCSVLAAPSDPRGVIRRQLAGKEGGIRFAIPPYEDPDRTVPSPRLVEFQFDLADCSVGAFSTAI